MGSFDFLPDWFPQMAKMVPNAGLLQDDNSRDAMRTAGLLSMANAFVNPQVAPGGSPSIMQTITGGLNGFVQGANAAAPQIYDSNNKAAMDTFARNNPDIGQKFGLPAGFPMNGNLVTDLAKHYATARPTLNGGATGALVQKVMDDNPGMKYTQALQLVQTGMRQGINMDENGNYVAAPGYAAAQGANKFGEESGKRRAELGYAAPIAQASASGKNTADLSMAQDKKAVSAGDAESILKQAEALLPKATGSGVGAIINAGKGFAGVSDEETQANAALEALGGRLIMGMPRMEGPQSNKDAALYAKMAGKIGDQTIPVGDRMAAMATIRALNAKYLNQPNKAAAIPSPPSANDIADQAQSLMGGAQGITGIDKPGNGFMTTPKGTKYRVVQ